ncbi:Oxidoreductase htatip2 [Coemansia sp. Benny D115]|nr:Oxidoreductase htatip2 [Coemansia sp. Benny D115]
MSSKVVKLSSENIVLGKGFIKAAEAFKKQASSKSAIVFGGTGEVGREVIKHLLASDAFDKVTVLTRRPIEYSGINADKLVQKSADYEDTKQLETDMAGHSHVFSCLGTTRSKSGSQGFYKVDHDYVLNAAKACKAAGVQHYSICSSTGANKNSWFLYTRTKGEVDDEVMNMGFASASVFRPAMIECEREELRLMEKLAMYVLPAVKLILPKNAGSPSSTIAWSMVFNELKPGEQPKSRIFGNADILSMFKDNQ